MKAPDQNRAAPASASGGEALGSQRGRDEGETKRAGHGTIRSDDKLPASSPAGAAPA